MQFINVYVQNLTDLPPNLPHVADSFHCQINTLVSLKGCSQRVECNFNCSYQVDANLTTLVGGPRYVGSNYLAVDCGLETFDGVAEYVGNKLDLSDNYITTLQNIHMRLKHAKVIALHGNPIGSHVLGLFLVKGLAEVTLAHAGDIGSLPKVQEMIKKFLPLGKAGLIKCQLELINGGLSQYAEI